MHEAIERPINRSIYNEVQHIFYSGKKKHHTVKNILITDGYVYFLSSTCEGKKHNKKIADEARYSLPEGSYLGQDSGFQGFDIPNVTNVQPKKKPQGGELTKDEKEQNFRQMFLGQKLLPKIVLFQKFGFGLNMRLVELNAIESSKTS